MREFKIGHTSDLHFGALSGWSPKNRPSAARDRHSHNMRVLLSYAKEENLDLLLCAGDIFDNTHISVYDFLAAVEFFKEATKICPVIVTSGNHDEDTKGSFITRLIAELKIKNLYVVEHKKALYWNSQTKWDVLVRDPQDEPTIGPEWVCVLASRWTGLKSADELRGWLLDDLHPNAKPHVVMLHECFKGCVTDSGYSSPKATLAIPDIGASYYACGDIHKYQVLNLPNAFMCGSPMQCKTDDDYNNKGFIVLDCKNAYEMNHRFVKFDPEKTINIIQIRNQSEINNNKDWYKLVCPVNERPLELHPQVMNFDFLPVVEDINLFVTKTNTLNEVNTNVSELINVDYKFGVTEYLTEGGFTPEEIEETLVEIDKQVSNL